jgi:hypothetical protein
VAVDAEKTIAVSRYTRRVVMLAQTGTPSRTQPDTVGVLQAAVAPHAGNEVDAVHRRGGTAEVDLPLERPIAAMAVVAIVPNIGVVEVGVVETDPPVEILRRRYVGAALPEAGMALSAPPLVVDRVGVELVRRGVAAPKHYGARDHHPSHGCERGNAS